MNTYDQGAITRFFNTVAEHKDTSILGGLALQIRSENGFYAAVRSGDTALVTRMLDVCPQAVHWQEQSWRDRGDETSGLHIAAACGDLAMARLLLTRGARVDAKDYSHATPLTYAVCAGQRDMVALLITQGADVTNRSHLGYEGTPASLAVKHGRTQIADDLKRAHAHRPPRL